MNDQQCILFIKNILTISFIFLFSLVNNFTNALLAQNLRKFGEKEYNYNLHAQTI